MRALSAEDIGFLSILRDELNTQDHDSQAAPRFWAVGDTRRVYGVDIDSADGSIMYETNEGDTLGETILECLASLDDWGVMDENEELWDEIEAEELEEYEIDTLCRLLNREIDHITFDVGGYRDEHIIERSTMFLTKRTCQEHIQRNHYHYKKPHTYAMTAWRNPEMGRLMEILENVDWEQILKEG